MRYLLVVAALLMLAVPGFGASSFVGGFSGNILTPDAVITPSGEWEISFHDFVDILDDGDLTSFGVQYGVLPSLEVGAALISDGSSEAVINGKYRIMSETATVPTVVAGVFDLTGSADDLDGDPGFYVAISKNITRFASEVADSPSKPLRLTIGAGSGVFDGFFAGFDWTLAPKFSLMAEFFSGNIGDNDSVFNAGARWAVTNDLRLDVGAIDFDNIAFGADYRIAF